MASAGADTRCRIMLLPDHVKASSGASGKYIECSNNMDVNNTKQVDHIYYVYSMRERVVITFLFFFFSNTILFFLSDLCYTLRFIISIISACDSTNEVLIISQYYNNTVNIS